MPSGMKKMASHDRVKEEEFIVISSDDAESPSQRKIMKMELVETLTNHK